MVKNTKNLLTSLVGGSLRIIREEGVSELIDTVKRLFSWHPLEGELWYLINDHLRSSPKVIKEVEGSKMLLNLSDRGIHKDLFLHGIREPECTRIFKQELAEGMKVMDIGANIGYYTLIEAQIIGTSGKIYAIEPDPENFKLLKSNVEMNSYADRVQLYNMAVGDEAGGTFLEISDYSNARKIARSLNWTRHKYVKTEMTTVDEFLRDKDVDFIRMDVEAFEYYIIKGMARTLNKDKPLKLFIEVHPKAIRRFYGESVDAMLENLSLANFKLKYLVKKVLGPLFALDKAIKYEQPLKNLLQDKNMKESFSKDSIYHMFLER